MGYVQKRVSRKKCYITTLPRVLALKLGAEVLDWFSCSSVSETTFKVADKVFHLEDLESLKYYYSDIVIF